MARDDERGTSSTSAPSADHTFGRNGNLGAFDRNIGGKNGRNGNNDPQRPPAEDGQRDPAHSDTLDRMPGIEPPLADSGMRFPGAEADILTPGTLGGGLRLVVREFLEAVPRSQAQASIALVRPDGSTRVFTRREFSAAVDALRPRMRQIVRLSVEERWPRQRVCDYLNNISIKTFERDHAEAFDALMEFVLGV